MDSILNIKSCREQKARRVEVGGYITSEGFYHVGPSWFVSEYLRQELNLPPKNLDPCKPARDSPQQFCPGVNGGGWPQANEAAGLIGIDQSNFFFSFH